MKSMCPHKRLAQLFSLFVLTVLVFSLSVAAQKKKSALAKKTVAKKTAKSLKDAKKDSRKERLAKDRKKDSRKEKATAKKDSRRDKLTAREKAREKNSKRQHGKKELAESRKATAERRRAEAARRAAELAERRRREQAAREARARRLAFERGLRTETAENILKDNTEGEDLNVRRAAVEALGSRAGTVVVMEAQTGKVLTIVNQDWAIRDSFKPCSTIKLVTGVAGLNENVIDNGGNINSMRMDLDYALAKSNNPYFQRVGVNMGSSKMIGYAKSLGLGEKTGINADGETPGKLPYGNNNARIYSHGDDFEVTPLQLAVMVSAISNGGRKVVPQVPRSRSEKIGFSPRIGEQVDVPMRSVQGVIPGMIGAAEYGTARRGVDASMGVAGKTGSCIGKGSWVGLFASVAPVEDPKYSVVVITRGQSERGKYAAAIAGKVYQALGGKISRNRQKYLALKGVSPAVPVDTDVAEAADDEEMDEAELEETEVPEKKIIVGSAASTAVVPQQAAPKKLVQKVVQSKPTHPQVVIEFDRSGAGKTRPRIVKN